MINVDTKDLKKMVNNLERVGRSAYPLAVRSTLNRMAFETANMAKKTVLPQEFTIRNKFIQKTVQYKRCDNTFNINQMESRAGQVDKFAGKKTDQLQHQEYGKSIVSKGKYTKVPTPSARSGNYKKRVAPSKLINKLNIQKLSNIVACPTRNKRIEIKQAVAFSRRSRKSFNIILTNSKSRKGFYSIKPKKVTVLYTFKPKVTRIKKTKWLEPTSQKIGRRVEKLFMEEGAARIEKTLSKGLKRL